MCVIVRYISAAILSRHVAYKRYQNAARSSTVADRTIQCGWKKDRTKTLGCGTMTTQSSVAYRAVHKICAHNFVDRLNFVKY